MPLSREQTIPAYNLQLCSNESLRAALVHNHRMLCEQVYRKIKENDMHAIVFAYSSSIAYFLLAYKKTSACKIPTIPVIPHSMYYSHNRNMYQRHTFRWRAKNQNKRGINIEQYDNEKQFGNNFWTLQSKKLRDNGS